MTSQPCNGKSFVQTQTKIWTSQWSVILRTFYRQILSLLYGSFFFWNFRHPLARELLVYCQLGDYMYIYIYITYHLLREPGNSIDKNHSASETNRTKKMVVKHGGEDLMMNFGHVGQECWCLYLPTTVGPERYAWWLKTSVSAWNY